MTAIEPGLYDGMPEAQYHGHKGSLSVSGAKKLLPPSCPAIYKWELDNGQPHKAAFDLGHAAHAAVLGVGAQVEWFDAPDWRAKKAQEWRNACRAEGITPLLKHEYAQVDGMAEAIKRHPIASALLDSDHGKPEVSMFWEDRSTGVMRRGRLDWLPDSDGGRLIVPDYKTAVSAEPGAIAKAVANFSYQMQARWYMDGVKALGLAEDVAFVFIFQEKTAPYLITVVELDDEALSIGGILNFQALNIYRQCIDTNVWPSYSSDIELIQLPRWYAKQFGDVA